MHDVGRHCGKEETPLFFDGNWLWIVIVLSRLRVSAGFLDGAEGFLLAVANAEGSYYRYTKAWLARR